ncbi:MAG: glycosyltransferase family 4 protein [Anaerobutyricum sp.]
MRILLLINWKIRYCDKVPKDLQPSDYDCPQETYWFFKYFKNKPDLDVVDISAPQFVEKIEDKVRFHFFQTYKMLFKLNQYDLIFVHGSNSAMLLCVLKRVFHIKTPPILDVDISSFHQAYTSGLIHKLSQFSSKAFDYMVYHTSSQYDYYEEYFPWLKDKCKFIPFGVDYNYWKQKSYKNIPEKKQYIVCVGYRKRDWNTLLEAFDRVNIPEKLYLIGNPDIKCNNPKVKVLPFIPIDELMTYIVNSKFSVIPLDDFNYSFGQMTLLQQMALGVPILAADVPAIRDYCNCSKGVISYTPYDPSNLAQKLVQMSNYSEDIMNAMAQDNMTATRTSLSEQEMARQFEIICNNIVGNINSTCTTGTEINK